MNCIIVVGRGYPEVKTGMNGIFEYEQAMGIAKMNNAVSYVWSDVRSIKYQKAFRTTFRTHQGVLLSGYNIPIGGISQKVLKRVQMGFLKKALRKVIKKNGIPDIVHIHFPLLTVDTDILEYLRSIGCKICFTEHWTRVLNHQLSQNNQEKLRAIAQSADCFICVSEELKSAVETYIDNDDCKKLTVIPNMVAEEFSYNGITTDDGDFSFLYAGRLRIIKRCDLLIQAFEDAFKDVEGVKLIIAGDGLERENLEQMKESYHDDRIVFKGFVEREKMPALYKQCDVYVSASSLETFGVPFAEAWMCGKPIICADNSPILPYLEEMENGIVFQTDNKESLKDALLHMYLNRKAFDRQAISELAHRRFSEETIINSIINAYKHFCFMEDK